MGTFAIATVWCGSAFSVRIFMGIATPRASNKVLGAGVSGVAEIKAFVALVEFNIFHG